MKIIIRSLFTLSLTAAALISMTACQTSSPSPQPQQSQPTTKSAPAKTKSAPSKSGGMDPNMKM